MKRHISRRDMLASSGLVAGASLAVTADAMAVADHESPPDVQYCLNTSTIRGHELGVAEEIDAIAIAGYDAAELWLREISAYQDDGGKLPDLKRRMEDQGITLANAIGFANWIVEDVDARTKGLDVLKRDMEIVRALGGTRIAAPPAGGTDRSLDLARVADRYRDALEVGDQTGVYPQLELWGFSKTLSRLGELMYVAVEGDHAHARLLLDVYHIYKGGSGFGGLELINGSAVEVLHMNDYPDIPAEKIGDADRVYAGDGVAPIPDILRTLFSNGFRGTLSLELFNRKYWADDVGTVLEKGLAGMKKSVAAALHGPPN